MTEWQMRKQNIFIDSLASLLENTGCRVLDTLRTPMTEKSNVWMLIVPDENHTDTSM